ncbi:TIGR01620 family protein [Rhodobacterales bacterium HKCCE3408]|nr:TIGR01620 family protein [Rhodobacterales bacterium HKCCE3408]
MTDRKGPVLIELDDAAAPSPADAPPVPGTTGAEGQAMRTMATLAARRRSGLARFFWAATAALLGFVMSVAAWEFARNLIERVPVLGWIAIALLALFVLAALLLALRELASIARLGRLDRIRRDAEVALSTADIAAARSVAKSLSGLYSGRPELRLGREALDRRRDESFEPDALFALAETEVMAQLDAAAIAEIEAAARRVATVTALVPLAFADVAAALFSNLRMIRRIAEIYGGRGGTLGAWRLTRAVMTHLVATGAVAVGDDLLGSVAGGSVLSRISRRFGEGLVNGALTARVGVATLEVCRPLPFGPGRRPSVTRIVRRALSGLFDRQPG